MKDTEIIAVFREESEGEKGLVMSTENTRATFPLLLDKDAEKTKAYSPDGFDTYLIDKQGKVRSIIQGVKTKRPSAQEILAEVNEMTP